MIEFKEVILGKFNNANIHYLTKYIKFISDRYDRILPKSVYKEAHHILPVNNFNEFILDKENFINLTAREHYLAHSLYSIVSTESPVFDKSC